MSDDLDLEAGRLLFARPFAFIKGCVRIADLPPADRVEIAFAGRSNVGKSSLINALTGTRDLARTSNTPGRTQELNIFEGAEGNLRIVDMPGYGFAQAPRDKVQAWTRLIHAYLTGRPNLGELQEVEAATRAAIAKRPAAHPELIVTSSETKFGIDVLRAEIAQLVAH